MDIPIITDNTSTQWLVLTPLFILILITFQWKWYQRKNRQIINVAAKLPSPVPSVIVLGHWYRIRSKTFLPSFTGADVTDSILVSLKTAADKPYSAFCLWAGPVPQILVQKPQDAQIILTSSKALNKGPEYRFVQFAFGDGLITAPGTKWKIIRRYMNPIFHRQNLNCLTALFNQSSSQLVKDMASHVDGEPFDVFKPLLKASVTSVCSILFGLESHSKMEERDFERGASLLLKIIDYTVERAFSPWLWSDRAFNFIYKKKLKEFEKKWNQFISQPMKEIESFEFMTIPKVYHNILQEHPSTFSQVDVHAEMKTVLTTGGDTTALAVGSCLMLLGTHPDIQEKLYKEIMSLLGSVEDQDVTIEDLNSLPFLEQVIKECLRISTIVIAFKRTFSEEIKLSECTIPKGGSAMISVVGLHFDPEVYPDPYVFKPERFTPENSAKRHPYSYLPFGGGPRNCIGKQYGMISVKIMLIHILRAYRISASENLLDLKYIFTISLKSIDGYKIRLERRT